MPGKGKPPKTVAEHKLAGTYLKYRHAKRAKPTQIGQQPIDGPPDWLPEDEAAQFRLIVSRKGVGFLTMDDTESLALLAHLHMKLARRELKMTDVTPFRLLSREFGNTPDSRYRMPGPPKSADVDPFDELMKRRKAQEVA
jgi:phage terminase small subunit